MNHLIYQNRQLKLLGEGGWGGPGKILLVRFGPAAVYTYLQYLPPDAALPPLQVRKRLFPYEDEEPPDEGPRAEVCDDLTTAWEISEEEHRFLKMG